MNGDDAPGTRMEAQDEPQGIGKTGTLVDTHEIRVSGKPGAIEIVGAAKHHRHRAEEGIALALDEVEGIVVGRHQKIVGMLAVFRPQRVQHPFAVFLLGKLFAIEVLDFHHHPFPRLGQGSTDAVHEVVRTLVAGVVGIEDQYLPQLIGLRSHRRQTGGRAARRQHGGHAHDPRSEFPQPDHLSRSCWKSPRPGGSIAAPEPPAGGGSVTVAARLGKPRPRKLNVGAGVIRRLRRATRRPREPIG